ncbi:MAG: hypothetical protein S4CHLAM81_03410 [Chlamydiales bacterium]|nr:hypothetical protein [Chlamydiales bacterium]MCH9635131.1 hypothetical protein [Chlamydiales bacterium]
MARMAVFSLNARWSVGLPRLMGSLSMDGRSSAMSEAVWKSSIASAASCTFSEPRALATM